MNIKVELWRLHRWIRDEGVSADARALAFIESIPISHRREYAERTTMPRLTDGLELFQDERILYVGPSISWEAQWEHGVLLLKKGCSVWIHEHSADARCRAEGAHCRCGRLTQETDGPRLDLISPEHSTTE